MPWRTSEPTCARSLLHPQTGRPIRPKPGAEAQSPRLVAARAGQHFSGSRRSDKEPTKEHPMDKFTTLTAVAAPLPYVNIDTDMIIPKQYLKTIKRTGLGTGLFSAMRYKDDGSEN